MKKVPLKGGHKGECAVIMDDHEYNVRYMPDGNKWVPWVLFIYKDSDGNPIGTTGQGYLTADSAIEYAVTFHNGFHWDGWLSPSAKWWPCVHSQHSLIVDLNVKNSNGDYAALLKKGWLLMRHGDFPIEWNYDVEMTRKQLEWIEAWTSKSGRPTPEICKPKLSANTAVQTQWAVV